MKHRYIPFLLISALLLTSLGLAAMSHTNDQGHTSCPFDVSRVSDCVQAQSSLDFATAHLRATSDLFSVVPIWGLVIVMVSVLAFVAYVVLSVESDRLAKRPLFFQNQPRETFVSPNKMSLVHWFALHEHSPMGTVRCW